MIYAPAYIHRMTPRAYSIASGDYDGLGSWLSKQIKDRTEGPTPAPAEDRREDRQHRQQERQQSKHLGNRTQENPSDRRRHRHRCLGWLCPVLSLQRQRRRSRSGRQHRRSWWGVASRHPGNRRRRGNGRHRRHQRRRRHSGRINRRPICRRHDGRKNRRRACRPRNGHRHSQGQDGSSPGPSQRRGASIPEPCAAPPGRQHDADFWRRWRRWRPPA
jgi:hypothetical protein